MIFMQRFKRALITLLVFVVYAIFVSFCYPPVGAGKQGKLIVNSANTAAPRFRVLALYENGGHHVAYSAAARTWLNKLAMDSSFSIDYIQKPDTITEQFLSRYQLFIQL